MNEDKNILLKIKNNTELSSNKIIYLIDNSNSPLLELKTLITQKTKDNLLKEYGKDTTKIILNTNKYKEILVEYKYISELIDIEYLIEILRLKGIRNIIYDKEKNIITIEEKKHLSNNKDKLINNKIKRYIKSKSF